MKELSIEQKAKAYDEALKVLHKYDGAHIMFTQDLKEEMFPELKESEDERIRKEIITYLSTVDDKELIPYESWIAWLEKQGENSMGISEATKQELEDSLNKALEKETPESCNEFLDGQGKQKPADKVEPKFHKGEWIVENTDASTWLITKVFTTEEKVTAYNMINQEGRTLTIGSHNIDYRYHFWTIKDAKDGDVLADNVGVILFRKIGNEKYADVVDYYCVVTTSGEFEIQEKFGYWGETKYEQLHPATKEQRDTLMKAMTDAGYEWDAEKLELRKIETEAKELTEQEITEWSKEDEDTIKFLISHFCVSHCNRSFQFTSNKLITHDELLEKIRNLRPHWKPSDNQMNALDYYANSLCTYCDRQDDLRSLYNDLKKL